MIKVPLNPAGLLLDNLKARKRLGLAAIPGAEQVRLKSWLNPAGLALLPEQPLDGQDKQLLANMLQVLGFSLEQVVIDGPARQKLHLCCQAPKDGGNWCWHPKMLLEKPRLKKQAYEQLKKMRKNLPTHEAMN